MSLKDEDFVPRRSLAAWLELLGAGLAVPAVGILFNRNDPFFLHQEFPWTMLPPLVIGLRQGFARGVGCAALVLSCVFVHVLRARAPFPTDLGLGVLLCGMLSGEFADVWARRERRLRAEKGYLRARLEGFTRAYHLLVRSHESLERRVFGNAGNAHSLREALASVQRQLRSRGRSDAPLLGMAGPILGLFQGFGWLQAAALLAVDESGELRPEPVARLGAGPAPSPRAPLLVRALKERRMVSVQPDPRPGLRPPGAGGPAVLAAVPLMDALGKVWGVLAVQEMPFLAFHQDHLNLLGILGGHIGDLLSAGRREAPRDLWAQLKRCLDDARRYGVPASLLCLRADPEQTPPALFEELRADRRGLDQEWDLLDLNGCPVLLRVMPLTGAAGVEGFVRRLEAEVRRRHRWDLAQAGLSVFPLDLSQVRSDEQMQELCRVCEIHAQ